MRLSFHTITYKNYSLEEAIKRIAHIGYEGYEIISIRPHGWPEDLDEQERRSISKLMKSTNLKLAAVANYSTSIGINLSSEKDKIREAGVQHLKDCINLAHDLECGTVMLIPGKVHFGTTYNQAWKWAVEGIRECMSLAEDNDIDVALEPAGNLLNSSDKTLEMAKELGSKKAKVCLDNLHCYVDLGESPTDCVRKWGKAIAHVHVWDGTLSAPVPPGRGHLNFEIFIEALKEIGYNGYLSVELPAAIEPDALAFESKRYLDGILRAIS